jgi:hypothetical protein
LNIYNKSSDTGFLVNKIGRSFGHFSSLASATAKHEKRKNSIDKCGLSVAEQNVAVDNAARCLKAVVRFARLGPVFA